MKKNLIFTALALLAAIGMAFAVQATPVQGEYLEARAASVYIGACHFGAEFVEGGKEATLIWNIQSGSWDNVSLAGLTVVAIVTAQDNLAIDTETRKSVLYVDVNATAQQRTAVTHLMQTKRAAILGKLVATKVAPITFKKDSTKYDVQVGEILTLTANRYPCAGCTQPHQIWYKPLTDIQNAIVGKSDTYRYKDKDTLPVMWSQGGQENNVFVGSFTIR